MLIFVSGLYYEPMARKRIILFIVILLTLLIVPTLLPYLIGHIVLPFRVYAAYSFIVLVNAGVYLMNRGVLIDRFFIKGRIWAFVLWNLLLLAVSSVLQQLAVIVSWRIAFDGVPVSEMLDAGSRISSQMTVMVFDIIVVLTSLAVALSDEWRLAAFRYREAASENERLGRDIDSLKGQVDALRRRESGQAPDSISVKVDLMMTKVMLGDIMSVRADGDYIVINKSDGQSLMTLMTLKTLEKTLPFDRFCRVHRSWIVNIDKVRGLKGGKLLVGNTEIPLSDSCKASFFERLSHKSIVLRTE